MTNVLVVNVRVPWPLDDGNALRIFELARHLDPDITCHVACRPSRLEGVDGLERQGVFDSVTVLPAASGGRDWRRLLRWGDRDYQRMEYPEHFATCVGILQDIVDRESIDVVVATMLRSEEFVRPLRGVAKVVDEYDCATLAHIRSLAAHTGTGWLERLRHRVRIAQARSSEKGLTRRCDLVTAISPPDTEFLRSLNPDGAPVVLVPNGVRRDLIERVRGSEETIRGVAFWGNLEFPVNREAIDYFYHKVWLPHLQPEGVRFAIVGPNADDELQALAIRHPEIEVPGFVDDLFGYLDRYPVMVNTMISGTGLKNKALEALAVGMAVVSTTMGIEALPAQHGVHCLIANDPLEIAAAVRELLDSPSRRSELTTHARALVAEHYTWNAVGSLWSELLRNLGGVHNR